MTDTIPHTKTDLLNNLAEGWQTLDSFLHRYTEAQLTQIKDHVGWTAKDHLSHFVRWEKGIIAFLDKQPRWEGMGIDHQTWLAHEAETFNTILHEQDKDRPLAEVLANLRATHDQLVARVTALSEADLFKPYHFFQPFEEDDPTDQRPSVNWIVGNTYEHYNEHLPWIEALIAAQPSA